MCPLGKTFSFLLMVLFIFVSPAKAQSLQIQTGDPVPRDVRDLYDRGLQYLSANQDDEGCWPSGHRSAGVAGMGLMCFLASGEDPNFGLYAANVRRAIRYILLQQDPETGYYGQSMYHHGFAMLTLAEAYGMVDDRAALEGCANRFGYQDR